MKSRFPPPSVALVLLVACSDEDATRPVPLNRWSAPPAQHGDACRDCHAALVDDWNRTGMARSLGPVDDENFAGLGTVDDAAGYRYSVRTSGPPAIVETRTDRPDHKLVAPLAFGIGAGVLDRSYAARRGPFLWFAPLEVVSSADSRHAALAPVHAIRPGSRFDNPITPECLGCHTDSPPPTIFPLNHAPASDAWQPVGISCAACHGSVDAHATWQEESRVGQDPVLRTHTMTRVQRLSVCAACHLQGDARIVLDAQEIGPPEPGGDLLRQRAVFVARTPTQDVGFVSQVERLVLSACFLESDSMVCESCHDPHRMLTDPDERRRVRSACETCHADLIDHAASTEDCASCHMRKTGVFDVAHVQIHDHFIRKDPGRTSPPGALRFPEDPHGDWRRFAWPGVPAPAHIDDPGLALMAQSHGGHFERAAALVDEPAGPTADGLPMYHHVRGSVLERLDRKEEALRAYERALALDPHLAASRTNLATLLGHMGRPGEALKLFDAVLGRHPAAYGALRNRALLHFDQGDLPRFMQDLQAAYELLPSAAVAATLASVFEQRGDKASARRWRRAAEELDPLRGGQ